MNKSIQQIADSEKRKSTLLTAGGIVLAVVIVIAAIIAIKIAADQSNTNASSDDSQPVTAELLNKVTTVPESVFSTVGAGTAQSGPQAISGVALTEDNKPEIIYIGAEYCPYCATERWAMVVALSRFGTFSGLRTSHSSTTDVFPNTQTFSFHGSTYTSQYIAFHGVETYSNQPQGSNYASLDTPTQEEQTIMTTYNAPPYVPASSEGSIPFIYFGGKYVISGASYDPTVLQGKSLDDIAGALSNANDPITKGVIGVANLMTAAVCNLTGDQPSTVCADPTIQALKANIK